MRESRIICDLCEKPESRTLCIPTGRRSNAAGEMEDETYEIDLCPAHTFMLLDKYARKYGIGIFTEAMKCKKSQ